MQTFSAFSCRANIALYLRARFSPPRPDSGQSKRKIGKIKRITMFNIPKVGEDRNRALEQFNVLKGCCQGTIVITELKPLVQVGGGFF